MSRSSPNFRSMGLAALAAGPVFVACLLFALLVDKPDEPVSVGFDPSIIDVLPYLFLILVAACIVGVVISFLPIYFGTTALTWLGSYNVGARLPAFWALIGGLMAGAAALFATSIGDIPLAAVAATGAIVATICNRGIRWDAALPKPRKGLVTHSAKG